MKKRIAKIIPLLYGQYLNLLVFINPEKAASKAFNLLTTIRKGRVLPQQKGFLDRAKSELLSIENHKIQTYHWPGKKETVVLVHGWESNTFRWRNLISELKDNYYNIITFDAPGHGNSTGKRLNAPLYAKILQYLIQKHNVKYLIGHSFGGMVILYNQYLHPDFGIEKIVTIASPSDFKDFTDQFQNILKFNNRVLKSLDNYILNRFGFEIQEFSTSEFVQSNTAKGLLFHDKFDHITPYGASKKVHKNWKSSKLVTTEGLGHSMHQPKVNEKIIDFLKS